MMLRSSHSNACHTSSRLVNNESNRIGAPQRQDICPVKSLYVAQRQKAFLSTAGRDEWDLFFAFGRIFCCLCAVAKLLT